MNGRTPPGDRPDSIAPGLASMPSHLPHSLPAHSDTPARQPKFLVSLSRPWMISFGIHLLILLILGWIVLPPLGKRTGTSMLVSLSNKEDVTSELFSLGPKSEPAPPSGATPVQQAAWSTSSQDDLLQQTDFLSVPKLTSMDNPKSASPSQPSTLNAAFGGPSATSEIRQAAGVSQAMDVITGTIRGQLANGDLLVAWLFDSSTSLQEHRTDMAQTAGDFFYELTEDPRYQSGEYGKLTSAVVAYGRKSRFVQPPKHDTIQTVHAMRHLPVDTSGVENVMACIDETIRRYRKRQSGNEQMMIVVLTDESGDDVGALENTIEECQRYNVPVHVLGPTSAFGLHKTRQAIQGKRMFTVWKGPESAMPERFHAGYWYENEPGTRPREIRSFPWYGGVFRECVPAGMGTYALTRLTLQTGGTYTLFDREAVDPSQGNYDLETLRDYLPGYEDLATYAKDAKQSRLRTFVLNSAKRSINSPLFVPPAHQWPMVDPSQVGASRSPFAGPGDATRSSANRNMNFPLLMDHLRATNVVLAKAQRELSDLLATPANIDWQEEYESEKSPRWRAWFDLNRGRMLAWSVRITEYLAANRSVSDSQWRRAQQVRWTPDETLRQPSSPRLVQLSMFHLQRCLEQHPETPWAALARWELENPMGTRVQFD